MVEWVASTGKIWLEGARLAQVISGSGARKVERVKPEVVACQPDDG